MDKPPPDTPVTPAEPKLLDQVRNRIRVKHYSIRTESQYVHWIKRFVLFHGKRHPREMGGPQIEAFLTDLAVAGGVSAATQNQALSALLFLYREVLDVELPWLENLIRAKPSRRLPVVLTPTEARAILERMDGVYGLMARLLYGTGMRLMECVRLRVKDVEFERAQILVREGKGGKDRVTMLPAALAVPLTEHLTRRRLIYEDDLAAGKAEVWLPDALAKKYPNATVQWGWQYIFCSGSFSTDPRSGRVRRHHGTRGQVLLFAFTTSRHRRNRSADARSGAMEILFQRAHTKKRCLVYCLAAVAVTQKASTGPVASRQGAGYRLRDDQDSSDSPHAAMEYCSFTAKGYPAPKAPIK